MPLINDILRLKNAIPLKPFLIETNYIWAATNGLKRQFLVQYPGRLWHSRKTIPVSTGRTTIIEIPFTEIEGVHLVEQPPPRQELPPPQETVACLMAPTASATTSS